MRLFPDFTGTFPGPAADEPGEAGGILKAAAPGDFRNRKGGAFQKAVGMNGPLAGDIGSGGGKVILSKHPREGGLRNVEFVAECFDRELRIGIVGADVVDALFKQ